MRCQYACTVGMTETMPWSILVIGRQNFDKDLLVTVLLVAVSAVNVLTSHRKICLSRPADATHSLSLAYANAFT